MEADAACHEFKSTLTISLLFLFSYKYLSSGFMGGDDPVFHVGLSHLFE
jgi:hypothetical protein